MINLKTDSWIIENIDTALFDKDGTFIDLHYFWGKMTEMRALEVIKFFNLDSTFIEKICFILGYNMSAKKMIPTGITALYSRKKIIEIFVEKLREFNILASIEEIEMIFDKVSLEFYKNIMDYTKPIAEAINFIKELEKNNVKLGIVTSDSVESTRLTLENLGLDKVFSTVIGRESSPEIKESGIPTKMALEALGANPETTIMIGDAPMDYISAKNAGIEKIILIATGQIENNELQKTSEYVLDSLKEIKCLKI